ncbi:HAD family phosphatase, partial [Pseudomonas aeruginosa]
LRSHPNCPQEHLRVASLLPFAEAQFYQLQRKPNKNEGQRLEQAVDEAAEVQAEAVAGALPVLECLDVLGIPKASQQVLP